MTRAAILLAALCLAVPVSALATGGYYDEDGVYHAADEEDPCKGHGGKTGPPTTGIDSDTWEWFDEYTCADGTKVRVGRGPAAPMPNSGYEPAPPPPPEPCEDHYTDEGWEECP